VMSEMKKRLQRKGARKGFTLVELLIVIIIIGILAGAMMLVAGTSRDAAEASKIISDLRAVKAAALMWLTENPNVTAASWDGTGTPVSNVDLTTPLSDDPTPLNKYLDKPLLAGQKIFIFKVGKVKASTTDTDGTDAWLLGYDLSTDGANVRSGVKENLEKQAKSAGLYGGDTILMYNPNYYEDTNPIAYIIVQ